jgi:hypothetical protein
MVICQIHFLNNQSNPPISLVRKGKRRPGYESICFCKQRKWYHFHIQSIKTSTCCVALNVILQFMSSLLPFLIATSLQDLLAKH